MVQCLPVLRNGEVVAHTVVDDRDVELLQWPLHLSHNGYVVVKRARIGIHRIILGLADDDPRDGEHRDRNRLNNQRYNLRIATRSENLQNQATRPHSSQFRGVAWNKKHKKWHAYGKVNQKMVHLGFFEDETEAGAVALAWRMEHHVFSDGR